MNYFESIGGSSEVHYEPIEQTEQVEQGSWVVLELFGHKVVAGYMSRDESLGAPLIRLDVPATSRYPQFSRHYNTSAIYSISYVSEIVARYTAESLQENPISVYVPALGELNRLVQENLAMKAKIHQMQQAMNPQLPGMADDSDDDPDNDDDGNPEDEDW